MVPNFEISSWFALCVLGQLITMKLAQSKAGIESEREGQGVGRSMHAERFAMNYGLLHTRYNTSRFST